jgi:hypothetical protein
MYELDVLLICRCQTELSLMSASVCFKRYPYAGKR